MSDRTTDRISTLLYLHIAGGLDEAQSRELEEWCAESDANRRLFDRISDMNRLDGELQRRRMINTSRPLEDMKKRIRADRWRKLRPFVLGTSAAAAAVALLLAAGGAFTRHDTAPQDEIAAAEVAITGITPGETKATLSIEAGPGVELGKDDGVVSKEIVEHKILAQASPQARQLSLEVPRGGEFKIILEDSTVVWLNSCSKLSYPESFTKERRHVAVTGEAYFEVAKDPRPFYVETEGQLVRVYGTEFNVRSYPEEAQIFTTLVSGSIALMRADMPSGELLLTPGHQALFSKEERDTSVKPVNADIVTSWRNGKFVFEGQTLNQIMTDLSRWYSFDYEFADEKLKDIEFMGSIPRYSEFDTVLAILEKSGGLHFEMKESVIVIY